MKQFHRTITTVVVIMVVVLGALVTVGGRGTSAQDATGSPTAMTGHDHPTHIHSGTCDTLGDVVYPLTNLTAPSMDATPTATASMAATPMATDMADVVAESTTTVEASLADLTSGDYAINVHESVENIGNYIACGDVTGSATDNALVISLHELNASGYEGQAMLTDNGDGTTTVTVMLMETDGEAMGTPVASPVA